MTPKPYKPTNTNFNEDGRIFRTSNNKAISELPKGITCHVLYEKNSADGNIYCFVVLKMNKVEKNYLSRIKHFQLGWINKKDLEKTTFANNL